MSDKKTMIDSLIKELREVDIAMTDYCEEHPDFAETHRPYVIDDAIDFLNELKSKKLNETT